MSRWQRDPLRLEIDATDWSLVSTHGELAREPAASCEQLAQQLAALQLTHSPAGAALDVTVHGRWVRSFVVEPPVSTRNLAELRQCVQARFETLFGDDGERWAFRAAWHPRRAFVVTALPQPLLDAVRSLCARHRWRLRTLRAGWVSELERQTWPRQPQWWAIVRGATVTVLRTQGARIANVRCTTLQKEAPAEAAHRVVERERLRALGDPTEQAVVRWVEVAPPDASAGPPRGRSPGGDLALLDFSRDDSMWSLPIGRWLGAAAASTALLVAAAGALGWQWHHLWREGAEAQQRLEELSSLQGRAPTRAQPRQPLTASQIDAINAAAHRLNTPWPSILHGIEEATPAEVAMLSIEPDGRHSRVRGGALARDGGAMFDYMRRLSETPPFVEARLLRHETDEKDPLRPLRFQFEVSLAPAGTPTGGAR